MKIFAVFIILVLAECRGENAEERKIGVTAEELMKMLKDKSIEVTVIDVRNPWELEQEGKIAGSINIPLNDLKAALSLSPEDFKAKYQRSLPKKNDCNLVFHCKSGGRSLKAVTMARQMGWFCSRHMLGGFNAWKQLGA